MRLWAAAAIVLVSGCVAELLGPPELSTRGVACAVLAPDMDVQVVQYMAERPAATLAVDDWMQDMAAAAGKTEQQFQQEREDLPRHDGPWSAQALRPWIEAQTVVGANHVVLRVLWVDEVPEPERAVELLAPGFVLINATAWAAGAPSLGAEVVAKALVYHGLGHAMGVVNQGVPLHEPDGAAREEPQHHEPGGVMDVRWHHLHSFPRNATLTYSEGLIGDWRHAQTSQAVCG